MGPQHSHRGLMMSLMALVAFAFTAALSFAPGTSRPSEASADTEAVSLLRSSAEASSSYTLFESGQVRPLALSPDKRHLFAVNTPDNRLEVFRIRRQSARSTPPPSRSASSRSPSRRGRTARSGSSTTSPTASASSSSTTTATSGRVVRTLLVGDEPRDIVFAGPGRKRAFITTAHRGQNIPFDPQLTTPGVGRADVWVFDADALGSTLGGTPLTIVTLFTDTPRALAVTPDGTRVYAAGFHSGNRTTIVPETVAPGRLRSGRRPGTCHQRRRPPRARGRGHRQVQRRPLGRRARPPPRPAREVLAARQGRLRASTPWPTRRASSPGAGGFFQGVGTILYNMAVNPVNGKVYVSNTEANNAARFEGPGHLRRPQPARPPAREPDHRARARGRRRAAAPQQAHRLRQLLRADPERRERPVPRPARRAWR